MFNLSLIILGFAIIFGSFQTDFMREEWKDVCVVRKHEDTHTYKGRLYFDHYLILKDSKGREFQRDVSVKLYTAQDVGSCFRFMLREANISKNNKDHLLYSFLPIIIASILIAFGVVRAIFPADMFKDLD